MCDHVWADTPFTLSTLEQRTVLLIPNTNFVKVVDILPTVCELCGAPGEREWGSAHLVERRAP